MVMGIDLDDHIVLGDSRYCSFKEMGKLLGRLIELANVPIPVLNYFYFSGISRDMVLGTLMAADLPLEVF
jgi:hypothetical protein